MPCPINSSPLGERVGCLGSGSRATSGPPGILSVERRLNPSDDRIEIDRRGRIDIKQRAAL